MQTASNRRFSSAHHADENNRSAVAIHDRNISLTCDIGIFADGTLDGSQCHLAFQGMEPAGAERHGREARRVSLLAQTNQTPYNCAHA
jgi:hypothetical protein